MASLWLNQDYTSIKSYGATVKGEKAIVRVEIEVSEPAALGYLLEDLGRVQRELQPQKAPASKRAGKKAGIEHTELLAIPDFRAGRS
tara:strand:+ start:202 stop:462 length:261 start_codon:yes stop_codon:yes gene_type:complete